MSFNKIESKTLLKKVYEQLLQKIIFGGFFLGQFHIRSTQQKLATATIILISFFCCFLQTGLGCSTFLLKNGSVLLAAHNLDMPDHIPGAIVINKRNVMKTRSSWLELTTGEKDPSPNLTWTSKYASVTFNPLGRDYPDGGMNEAGLFIEEMTLTGTKFPEDPSKPRIFMMQWMQYVLDSFSTVDQVIKSASQVTIDGWAWHFFTADKEGNAAVLEFLNRELVVYKGENLPLSALCNTKYSQEIERLGTYEEFGGDTPVSLENKKDIPRFVHAAYMLKHFDPSKNRPVDYAFQTLKQLERGVTQWSFVCDLKNLRVYFRTAPAQRIRHFDLLSFDLSCSTPVKIIDIHADLEKDISEKFKDYTLDLNRKFVKLGIDTLFGSSPQARAVVFKSQDTSLEKLGERIALYPERTKCK